jgi:hypothetical protein
VYKVRILLENNLNCRRAGNKQNFKFRKPVGHEHSRDPNYKRNVTTNRNENEKRPNYLMLGGGRSGGPPGGRLRRK